MATTLTVSLLAAALGRAQSTAAPPSDVKQVGAAKPCVDVVKDAKTETACVPAVQPKSTKEKFPYPGSQDGTAQNMPDSPRDDSEPAAAARPKPKTPLPAYPGDPEASPAAQSDDGFSSSSSSASPDAAGEDGGGLKDEGSNGEVVEPKRRRRLPKVAPETPESREAEDLSVAEFYQKSGNYVGAYGRGKDAVELQPNDPGAHLAVAEAARKLGKADEAKKEFEEVLRLDPAPKELKAAKKGLAELGVTAKR